MTPDQEAILALTRRLDAVRDVRRQLAELEHIHVLSTPEQAYRDAWRRLNAAIEGTDPLAQESNVLDDMARTYDEAGANHLVLASPERGAGGEATAKEDT
jgi:phage gpG-like protein